jgi:hypothetical protein
MSKPTGMPDDIWADAGPFALRASETALRNLEQEDFKFEFNAIRVQVALAILSERTKAAEIAESMFTPDSVNKNSKGKPYYAGEIAISCSYRISQAIRKGGKE